MKFDATFANPDGEGSKVWCQKLFSVMAEGGTWAVPRSGLIFQKRQGKLICTIRMPHDPKMPCSAAELKRQQDGDVRVIGEHFAAINVSVEDQSK
jgi:hypothetical protein